MAEYAVQHGGRAYMLLCDDTVRDYGKPDTAEAFAEECRTLGINDSMIHVDFMIGYDGLDIDAVTREGKIVPVFRRGRWAF